MKKLLHDKIISVDDFKLAIEELTNKKTFFIYLVVFEFLLNFSWYTDFYSINNIVVKLRWDVPGLVIAIVIIPIAAEIFTGASTASRLPKIIKERININIFHSDQHGGLKPFGNIMLFYVGIYSSTVVISLLVFEEIRRSIIVLPIFIAIFITVVSLPQISLYNLISASKNYWLTNLERRISSIITMKNIDSEISDPSSTSKISSNYLFLKTVKDQIDQVQAWSFDILTLYKVLTILLLPLLPMIIDFLKTVILIKFS